MHRLKLLCLGSHLVNLHYSDDFTDYPIDFCLWKPADLDVIDLGLHQQFPEACKSQHSSGIPSCLFVNRHAKMGSSDMKGSISGGGCYGHGGSTSAQHLCADALLRSVHDVFCHIPDHRKGDSEIPLGDALMSAFALFSSNRPHCSP